MRWLKFGALALLTSCASNSPRAGKSVGYTTDLFIPISFLENKSHLAMNVNQPPVQKIQKSIEADLQEPLKTRGESHITIINPIEYEKLKTYLPIEKINELARGASVQQASFKPICLGRGHLQIEGREESTYFIVVESEDLLKLRFNIKEAFVAAGGASKDFDEKLYFPHITIGFTKRDLHFEDGIIKNKTSCWKDLVLESR